MPEKKLKTKLLSLSLLAVVTLSISFYIFKDSRKENTPPLKSELNLPFSTILNSEESWGVGCCGKIAGYEADYAKIESISFAKNGNNLYVKHKVKGVIPQANNLPEIGSDDRLTHLIYRIAIDKNYTDTEGNVNPGGFDIHMKISFFGDAIIDEEQGVSVPGELVEGGSGHDYFVTKYPYDQLFFNQLNNLVFSADALVVTHNFPSGVTAFIFNNKERAADKTGEKINLSFE